MKFRYALLIFGLVLAGCGQASPAANTAATAPAASAVVTSYEEHGPGKDVVVIEHDAASVLVTLDLMRGHLVSSLETVKIGDYTVAWQHANHSFAEHYEQIKSLVQQGDAALDAQLGMAFKKYQQQIEAKAESPTIEQSKSEIEALLEKVEGVLVPIHTDVHSRAIAGVIETAAEEYAESIKDGAFIAPIEYQNAFGFTRVAEAHFAKLKPQLGAEAAQTTQTALAMLTAATPTIEPPQIVIQPTNEISTAAINVGDMLGMAQSAGSDIAAVEPVLNRLANEILGELDSAIDKNDVAAAAMAWEGFDAGWNGIKDGVRQRSKASYDAIEGAMDKVEAAVARAEKPSAGEVKAKTSALRAEIEKFAQTLK